MEIFEVGGAVRDALLGRTIRERDWVVVGGTPAELLELGYRQVGKDFPVFLHPDTGEEYALARTERKIGPGYHGFEVHASADVTLEEDLARRDLTINAIARNASGEIIDPYGGRRDLEARVLRHVSDAFVEDPLRVLRVARFVARFASLGFTVAPETRALMTTIVQAGEIGALRPELSEPGVARYFETLRDCGALAHVFPELDALFGVPQPPRWHPEIDTGLHTLMVLEVAAELSDDPAVRFAALTHDFGKGRTPAELLPKHHGHEERSVEMIDELCARLPVPRRYRELAAAVARYHGAIHRADEARAATLLKIIEGTDAIRRPDRFADILLACEADARGRGGRRASPYPQRERMLAAQRAAAAVDTQGLPAGLDGPAIAAELRQRRLDALAALST
jgi:tRNA nucleotidyltransferase (CCA-adding enzyme)